MAINHADIPGWLKSQGAIGNNTYQALLNHGHSKAALDAAIRASGITIGQKVQARLGSPASAPPRNAYGTPVSIDGNSWSQSRPKPYNNARNSARGTSSTAFFPTLKQEDRSNYNYNNTTNPLYNYSQGSVEDAANALGIRNINKQNEVNAVINYIRGNSGGGGGGGNQNNGDGGAFSDDIAAANAAAADLANRPITMGDFDERFGDLESLLNQSLTTGLEDMLMAQSAGYEQQIAQQNQAFENQIAGIEAQFSQANQFMNQQLQAANTSLQAAEQRANNMASAFVPQANPTALSVQYGDNRDSNRKRENNNLSDLTILSGLGTTANPLAGLQLA